MAELFFKMATIFLNLTNRQISYLLQKQLVISVSVIIVIFTTIIITLCLYIQR